MSELKRRPPRIRYGYVLVQMNETGSNPLARVCASRGAHCGRSARDDFESDAGLGERLCQFASMGSLSWISGHKPNHLMSLSSGGDQQRMYFFVEMLRFRAEFVNVADLRRGRDQIENLRGD
jgi:hypothetical protein